MDAATRIEHLLELSRPREALDLVKSSLLLSPHDVDLLVGGGLAHLALSQPAEALRYLDAAIATDPDRAELHAFRSQALLDIEYLSAAEEAARVAIALAPASARFHAHLACVLAHTPSQLDDARWHADLAVTLAPHDPEVHFARGFVERDDSQIAVAAYREALRLDPTHVAAMNNLALLQHARSPVALLRAFYAALNQDPQNGVVRSNLIDTLNRLAWISALAPLGILYVAVRTQLRWLALPAVAMWVIAVVVAVWRLPTAVRRAIPDAMVPMRHRARHAFAVLGGAAATIMLGAAVALVGPSFMVIGQWLFGAGVAIAGAAAVVAFLQMRKSRLENEALR